MGKAPADQFYWGDWLNDVELQAATSTTRGVWINALSRMWYSKTRGEISGHIDMLSSITNGTKPFLTIIYKDLKTSRFPNAILTPEKFKNNTYKIDGLEISTLILTETNSLKIVEITEFKLFLIEAKTLGFCEVSHNSTGHLTLRNRRMYRNEKNKKAARLRAKKAYDKKHPPGDSTKTSRSLSSSSVLTSPSKNKKKTIKKSIPKTFPVTKKMRAYAKAKKYVGDLEDLTENFLIHHRKKGSTFADWYAAWQNWLKNEIKFYPERNKKDGSAYNYPQCNHCGAHASSIRKGQECPICGEVVDGN